MHGSRRHPEAPSVRRLGEALRDRIASGRSPSARSGRSGARWAGRSPRMHSARRRSPCVGRACFVPVLLLGLLGTSCTFFSIGLQTQTVPIDVKRYSIDVPPVLAPADTTLPLSILVLPFQADAAQKGERIMYRDEEHAMDYYYYNRWVAPPAVMLGNVVSQHLFEWGLAGKGVLETDTGVIPTHEVYGRLTTLYADNRKNEYSAHFEASLTVVRVDPKTFDKEVIFQKTYPIVRRRNDREVASYVNAANLAVRDWMDMLRSDLEPLFHAEARWFAATSAGAIVGRPQAGIMGAPGSGPVGGGATGPEPIGGAAAPSPGSVESARAPGAAPVAGSPSAAASRLAEPRALGPVGPMLPRAAAGGPAPGSPGVPASSGSSGAPATPTGRAAQTPGMPDTLKAVTPVAADSMDAFLRRFTARPDSLPSRPAPSPPGADSSKGRSMLGAPK